MGKVKNVTSFSDEEVIIEFTDYITAGNGKKKEEIRGKGKVCFDINNILFNYVMTEGVKTHFIKACEGYKILAVKLDMIPIEVVCRNVIAGSFARNLGLKEGEDLIEPIIDFYYKKDELNDPQITENHITALNILTETQINEIKLITLKINEILKELFEKINIKLVDFKIEVGINKKNEIILGDELSPDNMRLWENNESTTKSLDKDLYRKGILQNHEVIKTYEYVYKKLKETQ